MPIIRTRPQEKTRSPYLGDLNHKRSILCGCTAIVGCSRWWTKNGVMRKLPAFSDSGAHKRHISGVGAVCERAISGYCPKVILKGMVRVGVVLLSTILLSSSATPEPAVLSVCELSKDFSRYRDKLVTVRGVYYYGLRQKCPCKCAENPWPSFIDLEGGSDAAWEALNKTDRAVQTEAKRTGKRFEIWVTVKGRLHARSINSPIDPCDRKSWGHYGHLGAFPAQITVESFREVEVRSNPQSPYDYANMYHGPL
jgi:hypothetical protein